MPTETPENPFIMVADDDKFLVAVLKINLTKAHYEVLAVSDGEETMKALRTRMPDLLILDLIMPAKDGFEVIREMKADDALKDIKIVVLTNLSKEEEKQRVLSMGVSDYMVKGNISIDDIVKKVGNYLPIKVS